MISDILGERMLSLALREAQAQAHVKSTQVRAHAGKSSEQKLFYCAVYIPAVLACRRAFLKDATAEQRAWMLFAALLQPAAVLIDHGHFQYNGISLGFAVRLYCIIWSA